MPRNRHDESRQAKRDAIVAAASSLFLSAGYDGASMGKIAAAAGVTPTTLYWYFGDKDELFVAVADLYLEVLLQQHETVAHQSLAQQFVWLVDNLRPVRHLVATVHARVARSPRIAEWHSDFHRQVEALFEEQLTIQVSGAQRDAEAAVVTFAIEGAVTHDLDAGATADLCHSLVQRLAAL
ncbi:TetR/AcrR family transcriptional regulator [Nocardioides limicola]|uniref:TetR/AcrR family transcriptional regulator n=1 Tax=Nocardioides limicola TaxID=2803368 RepID=UPI00193C44BB|nr:TetR/AcrR family transcriptional regulator [Nocardioides sp. DJM-14]